MGMQYPFQIRIMQKEVGKMHYDREPSKNW